MVELERLRAHGARIALRDAAGELSYEALAAQARGEASRLAEAGLGPGQRVAVACPTRRDAVVRVLGAIHRGVTLLPLDGSAPAEDLRRQAAGFGADWLLGPDGSPAPGPGGKGSSDGAPDAPAQALLSSGSSGRPKLVLRSRAQVEAGIRIHVGTLGIGLGDRVLAAVSLGHSYGFNSVLLGTLGAGAQLVLPASGHPRELIATLARDGVTRLGAPPVLLDLMVRFRAGEPLALPELRTCISVGEALPLAVHRAFEETFGLSPWPSYGASEAGPALLNRDGAAGEGVMALGTPYDGVEVELLDASGRPAPEGEVGEIVVRSPAVGLGYDGDPGDPDRASRIEAGRFYSGDLGLRRDGVIHFAGRKKLLIATAGRKISPEEVEQVLRSHPDVDDAVVVGRRQGSYERAVALVVARRPLAAEALLGFCSARLAAYKVPTSVEFRASLPRGPSGKLLRSQLA